MGKQKKNKTMLLEQIRNFRIAEKNNELFHQQLAQKRQKASRELSTTDLTAKAEEFELDSTSIDTESDNSFFQAHKSRSVTSLDEDLQDAQVPNKNSKFKSAQTFDNKKCLIEECIESSFCSDYSVNESIVRDDTPVSSKTNIQNLRFESSFKFYLDFKKALPLVATSM